MRGWTRWAGGAVAAALVAITGALALGDTPANFPSAIFQFIPATGLIRAEDHNQLGREIAATENALGVGMAKIAKVYAPCIYIEQPASGETFSTVWTAPQPGRLTRVSCDTSGVSSQVPIDLLVDDGTPASAGAAATCTPTSQAIVPSSGAMAEGDRLRLALGTIVGSASRISVCLRFEPGA